MSDSDVAVVGGAHVEARELGDGLVGISKCVCHPMYHLAELRGFYGKDIAILLDLRVSLQLGEFHLNGSDLYEVNVEQSGTPITVRKVEPAKPSPEFPKGINTRSSKCQF